jgi:hypothetical protein
MTRILPDREPLMYTIMTSSRVLIRIRRRSTTHRITASSCQTWKGVRDQLCKQPSNNTTSLWTISRLTMLKNETLLLSSSYSYCVMAFPVRISLRLTGCWVSLTKWSILNLLLKQQFPIRTTNSKLSWKGATHLQWLMHSKVKARSNFLNSSLNQVFKRCQRKNDHSQ